MTDSGTTLQPFIARGWSIRSASGWKLCAVSPGNTSGCTTVIAVDSLAGTATRVIATAALVAEGHDLIGLLRDASVMLASGDAYAAEVAGRIDAVLAAVDGAT